MQCWKKIASAALLGVLAGCGGGAADPLRVTSAEVSQGVLSARLQWQPNEVVLDALDHGIVLDFVLDLRAYGAAHLGWRDTLGQTRRRIELRYFPLSRRYQLRDLDSGETRSYAARALLVAALEDVRLDLPPGWQQPGATGYALQVELDRERLPGALRLPALLRREWHLSSKDYSWPVADAG
jgi:hypothetical protein